MEKIHVFLEVNSLEGNFCCFLKRHDQIYLEQFLIDVFQTQKHLQRLEEYLLEASFVHDIGYQIICRKIYLQIDLEYIFFWMKDASTV